MRRPGLDRWYLVISGPKAMLSTLMITLWLSEDENATRNGNGKQVDQESSSRLGRKQILNVIGPSVESKSKFNNQLHTRCPSSISLYRSARLSCFTQPTPPLGHNSCGSHSRQQTTGRPLDDLHNNPILSPFDMAVKWPLHWSLACDRLSETNMTVCVTKVVCAGMSS